MQYIRWNIYERKKVSEWKVYELKKSIRIKVIRKNDANEKYTNEKENMPIKKIMQTKSIQMEGMRTEKNYRKKWSKRMKNVYANEMYMNGGYATGQGIRIKIMRKKYTNELK